MDERFAQAEWLFFDIGYTLIDETPAVLARAEAAVPVLAEHGVRTNVTQILAGYEEAARRFAPGPFLDALVGLLDGRVEKEALRRQLPYRTDLETSYDRADEVLSALHGRFRLGVIANQLPGSAARLAAHGLSAFFDVHIASAEAGVAKPDPAIFAMALDQAGCSPERAVMIGDRLDNDVGPARALGWRAVRVRQGVHINQLPRHDHEQADATIDDLPGLLALL